MLRSLTYGFRAVSSIAAAVSPIAARCSVSGCGRSSRLTTSASLSRTKDEPRARRARSRTHTPSAPSRGTDSQRCHADRTSGRAGARRSQAGFADRTSGRAGARRSQAGFADRTSGRAGARRSQACPAANCPIGLEPATVRSVSSLGSPRSSVALCPSDEAGASAVDRGYVTPTGLQAGLEPGDPRLESPVPSPGGRGEPDQTLHRTVMAAFSPLPSIMARRVRVRVSAGIHEINPRRSFGWSRGGRGSGGGRLDPVARGVGIVLTR